MTDPKELRTMIEDSERRTSAKIDDLDRRVDDRLHEHGKHISRIEGQMVEQQIRLDERHKSLLEAQSQVTLGLKDINRQQYVDTAERAVATANLAKEQKALAKKIDDRIAPIEKKIYLTTGVLTAMILFANHPDAFYHIFK